MIERRRHSRHSVRIPVEAIPVASDGRPHVESAVAAVCLDVSESGLRLEWDSNAVSPPDSILVRCAAPDLGETFAGLELRHHQVGSSYSVGGSFGGPAEQILSSDLLLPKYDPQTQRYEQSYPQAFIDAWCKAGILTAELLDRVQLCPRCHTLPTFRGACRRCLSGRVDDQRHVHHFGCGHLGPVETYEKGDRLVCPKCRSRGLVVGTDFEYVSTYECRDCHWAESELEQTGHCLSCDHRFLAIEAHTQDLIGYRRHARRLDALALLPQH